MQRFAIKEITGNLLLMATLLLLAPATGRAAAGCDSVGNCYVRAGATGSGSGADWTNAYTKLPATLTRGVTYYLASGSYPSYFANTANSGTTTITIQAATAASHGTATGWSISYATDVTGPAVFLAGTGGTGLYFNYTSDYWIVNGNGSYAGMGCGPGGAGCNFKIDGSACTNSQCHNLGLCEGAGYGWPSCPHDISVSYMEILGAGYAKANVAWDNNVHDDSNGGTSSNGGGSNFTLSHLYIHGSSGVPIFTERASGITLDHSYILGNVSTSANHGEGWADQATSNVTISNNAWEDSEGSGFIVELDRGGCVATCTANNWQIYGNIFWYDNGNKLSCKSAPCNTGVGDGVIACINALICSNWKIYQNDMVNIIGYNAGLCEDCLDEGNVASTWTVENNLWWNNTYPGIVIGSGLPPCSTCTMTEDYNSFLGYNSGALSGFTGAHDVFIQSGPPNPFVGWAGSPPDFHLSALNSDWTQGITLPSPYNTDPDGRTRGGAGSWARGAYEFVAGSPNAPANLQAVPH
jgi:hypothetical protein